METLGRISLKDEYIVSSEPSPLFARILLLAITIISFLFPIIVTVVIAITEIQYQIGFIVTYMIFWGIGIFLFRAFLWNTYGKEIITCHNDKVSYVADYKYFRDGSCDIPAENLNVYILKRDAKGLIRLSSGDISIQTVSLLPIIELEQIKKEIESRYNTV
ncbi:MAG: hypothetical protein R2751_09850 [Bacteroidales bacterium]